MPTRPVGSTSRPVSSLISLTTALGDALTNVHSTAWETPQVVVGPLLRLHATRLQVVVGRVQLLGPGAGVPRRRACLCSPGLTEGPCVQHICSSTMASWPVPDHMRKPRRTGDPVRAQAAALAPVWGGTQRASCVQGLEALTFPLGRSPLVRSASGRGWR